mmetsp:Transcript_38191/g.70498  ORF Transcript_38191/g.70498 Transcript_38191/m.70498 type:complete len:96 (-) Transcript_38191:38-325(-)
MFLPGLAFISSSSWASTSLSRSTSFWHHLSWLSIGFVGPSQQRLLDFNGILCSFDPVMGLAICGKTGLSCVAVHFNVATCTRSVTNESHHPYIIQ